MKKQAVLLFFALSMAINASAEIQCAVQTDLTNTCQDALLGSTIVLRISSEDNAHAELPGQSKYNIGICCKATQAALEDTTCTDPPEFDDYYYTALSDFTNAHAEFPIQADNTFDHGGNKYSNELCMNATGEIKCKTLPALDDPTTEGFIASECVFGLSSKENAHVYTCGKTPNESGFFKVYCTDESRISGDILELKIRALNEEGLETTTFYTSGKIYLELNLKNFTNEDLVNVPVTYEVQGTDIRNSIQVTIPPTDFPPMIIEIEIPNDTNPDSYILQATATYNDDPVQENNSDKAFITILTGTQGVSVPEINPFLVALIGLGVLLIIGQKPRKSLN